MCGVGYNVRTLGAKRLLDSVCPSKSVNVSLRIEKGKIHRSQIQSNSHDNHDNQEVNQEKSENATRERAETTRIRLDSAVEMFERGMAALATGW